MKTKTRIIFQMKSEGAVVCEAAQLFGDDITIGNIAVDLVIEILLGERTIVHPKAVIDARKGPVRIGRDCIVEERASIVNQ